MKVIKFNFGKLIIQATDEILVYFSFRTNMMNRFIQKQYEEGILNENQIQRNGRVYQLLFRFKNNKL